MTEWRPEHRCHSALRPCGVSHSVLACHACHGQRL